MFGRDLVSLWRRHRSIPVVILSCCERLEQDFMNTPYLLDKLVLHEPPPIEGEEVTRTREQKQRDNAITNLRRKCDTGMTHTIKWDEITDPLVFIGLLRTFFYETKPPLCGAYNYDRFVDAIRPVCTSLSQGSYSETHPQAVLGCRKKIQAYTGRNRGIVPGLGS